MSLRSLAPELKPSAQKAPLGRLPEAEGAAPVSFAALLERLSYLSKADHKRVLEAYKFADEAHLGQFRVSGEPYITHPIAVAGLVADWKLDAQAIMAALMHDAMEDCGVTKVELIERFGAPTAELVDGLTKLDKLQFSTREEGQAESFRKMLLAMSRDVRVILIKLCDRLHNMRTMEAMAPHKRARIARETLDIYAPIAHRLGLNQTYRELQELSFSYIHPWRHGALDKAVLRARGYDDARIAAIEAETAALRELESRIETARAEHYARRMLEADSPRVRIERWPLGPELGQCCGGSVTLWFERLTDDDAAFLDALQAPTVRARYENLDQVWNERAVSLNRRLDGEALPVRVANLSTVWTITYTTPSRYNWMFQYYLRAEGLALSWVGSGRIVFSLNYTDADFAIVCDRFVAAAAAMA